MNLIVFLAVLVTTATAQQARSLICGFQLTALGYTCVIPIANLQQVNQVNIVAENHQQDRNNGHVVGFSLDTSNLNFFPLQAFELFPNLEQISFPRARIPTLEASVFANRQGLRFIDLENSGIRVIEEGAFNGLIRLETLILSNNEFATLPRGIFDFLESLRVLRMDTSTLTRLEANLFANTPNLNILSMQSNQIRFMHRGTFDNLRNLQQLAAGGNPCGGGANLNFFEIQNGDLTNILPLLSRCFGVTSIMCDYTNNTQILGISEFAYTCTVEGQTLEERQRSEVKEFGGSHLQGMGVDSVINLRINYSKIPFFLTEMFTTFPNLRAIEITNGGLQQIRSNDFLNGQNLESIYMQYNNLKVLDGGIFAGLSKLQKLSLGKNEIERVDGNAFSGLTSLRLLYLQENRIRRLHRNTFNSLRELRDLNMRANYLTRISSLLFNNNPQVGVIMMDSNQIAAIDEDFLEKLPRLAVLNLLNNRCVNALFDGNRVRINEGLRSCYEEFRLLPADYTRQFIMEIDGEVGLIDNDGGRIEL